MQIPSSNPYAGATSPYASAPAASGLGQAKTSPGAQAVQDFLGLVNETPAQQMRDQILRSMGLTEDQLKAMDPKERAKVEEKIKEMIKEKVQESTEKKTGVAVDIKA